MTGIVILVPAAEAFADHAHVTLLAPFGQDGKPTPEETGELERFFAEVTPFDFTITGESRFPSGMRYLVPEPASTFSRLTHRLHRLFPEYPPYEGQFDLVVPHLTIRQDVVVEGLPVHGHASAAILMRHDADTGDTAILDRFPFGTSAA